MNDALPLLLLPFAASVVFVLIHAYLGVHVLRRNVVFADLALAQLSALGATVAFAEGYAPVSPAGFAVNKGDPDFLAFLNAWITARNADTWLPTTASYWFESLRWRERLGNARH